MKIVDSKLKHLIHLCKQTQNYKKIAVVGFILLSNVIDEIGANLGIRARKKKENEHLYQYMEFINMVFQNLIKSPVFMASIIERLKVTELIFLKLRGELPYDHIKKLFSLYFELQELDVPNVFGILGNDFIHGDTDLNLYMTMATKGKNHESSRSKQLLIHNIHQKEIHLQKSLEQGFDKECFEEALYLKKLKTTITSLKKKGRIQDSFIYQISEVSNLKYIILGVMAFFMFMGINIIYEMILFPNITMVVSFYLLLFSGSDIVLLIVYKKLLKSGES
ncbi:MAG: hypothetical protein ACFFBH_10675 [Promethearchaeota archaeon]